jgi:hypothetical protein
MGHKDSPAQSPDPALYDQIRQAREATKDLRQATAEARRERAAWELLSAAGMQRVIQHSLGDFTDALNETITAQVKKAAAMIPNMEAMAKQVSDQVALLAGATDADEFIKAVVRGMLEEMEASPVEEIRDLIGYIAEEQKRAPKKTGLSASEVTIASSVGERPPWMNSDQGTKKPPGLVK